MPALDLMGDNVVVMGRFEIPRKGEKKGFLEGEEGAGAPAARAYQV